MFKKRKPVERQRSRPQTSQSPRTTVFSYYTRPERPVAGMDKSSNSKESLKRPKSRNLLRKTGTVLVVVVSLVLLVLSLVVTPQPKIKILGDQNSQFFLQDQAVYHKAAQEILASSALNRNKLIFDASKVSQQMRKAFPELAAVSVSLPAIGWQPIVHVQAFSPSVVLVGGRSGDFVLDPEGRAFAPGSLRSSLDKLQVPIVRDQSGLQVEERKVALPASQVSFITEVHRQLKAKEVQITDITLPAGAAELEVRVHDKPYVVRFNLYGEAREGAGRYLAAASYLESRGQTPQDYIDVRVDGRVFYK